MFEAFNDKDGMFFEGPRCEIRDDGRATLPQETLLHQRRTLSKNNANMMVQAWKFLPTFSTKTLTPILGQVQSEDAAKSNY